MTTLATSNPVVTVQGPLTTNGATGIIGQPAQATTTTTYVKYTLSSGAIAGQNQRL